MRINKGILFVAGLAVLLLPFCSNQGSDVVKVTEEPTPSIETAPTSEIAWIREDYSEALAQAEADGKLMMIDVYTDWCVPCKKLDKSTFPAKEVVDKAANFVSLKLDAEKGQGPEVQKQFGVSAYPTILFVDGKGNLVHSVIGLVDPETLVAEMDKALDKAS